MPRPFAGGAVAVALLLAGCGSTGSTHHTTAHHASAPPICDPLARDAMAQMLAVPTKSIVLAKSTGNNGSPQCSFTAHIAGNKRVEASINDDDGPQPYFVLERTAIEASQQFAPTRLVPAPQGILGLGLEADWFPAGKQLMATDGIRLITATVDWHGTTQRHRESLAEALTRPYLNVTKQGRAAAKGYP